MKDIKVGCVWHNLDGYTPIYIGRPGKGKASILGNPYTAKEFGLETCLKMYEDYLTQNMSLLDPLKKELEKNNVLLQCFCKKEIDNNRPCHGDVIKKIINGEKS